MDAWDIFNVVIKVVQAAFQVKKAVEVRKEAKYRTDILRQEAKQAKEDAADERQQGLDEARRIRLKSILNMSEMKSDIASNNILLSSKTALNLVTDEKLNVELDALVTLQNSERTAENYLRQSQKYYQNSSIIKKQVT